MPMVCRAACVAVLSSLRLRSTLVARCELHREEEKVGCFGDGVGGPYSAEVVRVRGLERRDGKDRNLDGTDTMSNGSSS